MRRLVCRLLVEETGGQVTEYALVLGLIAVAAVAAITTTGTNLANWWNGLANYLGGLRTP
jgi:Flp pilus assembly pilin Flp